MTGFSSASLMAFLAFTTQLLEAPANVVKLGPVQPILSGSRLLADRCEPFRGGEDRRDVEAAAEGRHDPEEKT